MVYRNWQKMHGVRRLEVAVLTRYLELAARQRILDVGSGKGALSDPLPAPPSRPHVSPRPMSGMILAAKAVRRESLVPTGGSRPT